jgi:hypothetical protein
MFVKRDSTRKDAEHTRYAVELVDIEAGVSFHTGRRYTVFSFLEVEREYMKSKDTLSVCIIYNGSPKHYADEYKTLRDAFGTDGRGVVVLEPHFTKRQKLPMWKVGATYPSKQDYAESQLVR